MEREDPSSALTGDWLVDSIGEQPVAPEAPRSVHFEAGRVTGKVGVNRFTGSYTISGDTLVASGLASTRMAGPPELMALEGRFNSHIEGEHQIGLSDNSLVLSEGDRSIHMTRVAESSVDGNWLVATIADEPVDPEAPRMLRFEEGRVMGQVGVNRFTGPYKIDGDMLAIGQTATTLMAGPAEMMELEDHFASHLVGEHEIRMEGGHLVLSGEEGSIRLTRAPPFSVQGKATYRERVMLPPGSLVTVELIDISLADTAVEPIASQVIGGATGPPILFTLTSSEAIDETRRLAIRARVVSEGGDLLWVTDTPTVVTATDEPIELLLRRV